MARKYRCRYTVASRCKAEATVRLRLTFSIVSDPQLTRVCPDHAVTLAETCSIASIGYEILPR